jgi:hypothetical protein
MNSPAKTTVCSKCKNKKKIEDFYKSNKRKCGYESGCKDCRRAAALKYSRTVTATTEWKEQRRLQRQKHQQRTRGDIKYVLKAAMQHAKARARKQNVPCDLTVEYLESLVVSHCPITKEPLDWERSQVVDGHPTKNSPSLDKIIPALGYVPGNCAFLSHRGNAIKSNGTMEEHSRVVRYMAMQQLNDATLPVK